MKVRTISGAFSKLLTKFAIHFCIESLNFTLDFNDDCSNKVISIYAYMLQIDQFVSKIVVIT